MKFQPVSHSWVALHPKPQGVIQFIGGAFFGTFFPMFFYRSLLQCIFDSKYTIILLPFNFTFDHYAESGFLIREQYKILPELVRMAVSSGFDYRIYLNDKKFSWVGHSIGCKYIALLEGLTALSTSDNLSAKEAVEKNGRIIIKEVISSTAKNKSSPQEIEKKVSMILSDLMILIDDLESNWSIAKQLIKDYIQHQEKYKELEKEININSIFIKDQPSLLLAPVNTGLEAAVPKPFSNILINLGLDVKPTPTETETLIKKGNLFNLLGLISFQTDQVKKDQLKKDQFKTDELADSTCEWFDNTLKKPPSEFRKKTIGGHLRPLGIRLGNLLAINFPDPMDKIPLFEPMKERKEKFESIVIHLLQDLLKLVK